MAIYYQAAVEYLNPVDNNIHWDIGCFCNYKEATVFLEKAGHQLPEMVYTGNGNIVPTTQPIWKGIAEYFDVVTREFFEDTQCFCSREEAVKFACNRGHQIRNMYYTGENSLELIYPPIANPSRQMIRTSYSIRNREPLPQRYPNVCPSPPTVAPQSLPSLRTHSFTDLFSYMAALQAVQVDSDFVDKIRNLQADFIEVMDRPDYGDYLRNNRYIETVMRKCRQSSPDISTFMQCLPESVLFNFYKFLLNTKLTVPLRNLEDYLNNAYRSPLRDIKTNLKAIFAPLGHQIVFRDWESKMRLNKNLEIDQGHLSFRDQLYRYNKRIQTIYNIISLLDRQYSGGTALLIPLRTALELRGLIFDLTTSLRNSPHYHGDL